MPGPLDSLKKMATWALEQALGRADREGQNTQLVRRRLDRLVEEQPELLARTNPETLQPLLDRPMFGVIGTSNPQHRSDIRSGLLSSFTEPGETESGLFRRRNPSDILPSVDFPVSFDANENSVLPQFHYNDQEEFEEPLNPFQRVANREFYNQWRDSNLLTTPRLGALRLDRGGNRWDDLSAILDPMWKNPEGIAGVLESYGVSPHAADRLSRAVNDSSNLVDLSQDWWWDIANQMSSADRRQLVRTMETGSPTGRVPLEEAQNSSREQQELADRYIVRIQSPWGNIYDAGPLSRYFTPYAEGGRVA